MEGRPPPDLEPQNQQEEEEVSVVSMQKIFIIIQLKFGNTAGFLGVFLSVLLLEIHLAC